MKKIVEEFFDNMTHTAQNPLRQFMLNYKYCLYGVSSEKILMDVIIRMCKEHLFTRFGMKVLNAKDYSIVIACPVSVYASANDILIDIIKKACRQADREKKIVPKITLDNKLM